MSVAKVRVSRPIFARADVRKGPTAALPFAPQAAVEIRFASAIISCRLFDGVSLDVSSLRDIPDASAALIEAGFEPRGNRYDDDVWAFLLKRPSPQTRVYLCSPSNLTHDRRVLFRNYLRKHNEAALAYSALKRRLAEQFPYDGDRYTSEKSAFISEIVCSAQKDAE